MIYKVVLKRLSQQSTDSALPWMRQYLHGEKAGRVHNVKVKEQGWTLFDKAGYLRQDA